MVVAREEGLNSQEEKVCCGLEMGVDKGGEEELL